MTHVVCAQYIMRIITVKHIFHHSHYYFQNYLTLSLPNIIIPSINRFTSYPIMSTGYQVELLFMRIYII